MRRRHFLRTTGAAGLSAVVAPAGPARATGRTGSGRAALVRNDVWATGEDGKRIFVREILPSRPVVRARPLLLVHGARPGGTAAFDLPVPGGSLAADLALAGFPVYVMEVRGFGHSDHPPAMGQDPSAAPPQVRSGEAAADIDAAVSLVRRRRPGPLSAFGWATGGHWLATHAAWRPGRIADLVLLNTLCAGTGPWPLQSELEDPENPGRPRPQPAWRAVTADSLTARWDSGLSDDDPDARRDPAVRDAYRSAALSADPTSGTRMPPAFRNPTGPLVDAFHLAQGRPSYDAGRIRARTLLLRAERDFWSRPGDGDRLARRLVNARDVRVRTLPEANHYVHLERPRYGRDLLLDEIREFLGH
ncbi:alpha/beta hydrolase [Streptomyces hebeiensis]